MKTDNQFTQASAKHAVGRLLPNAMNRLARTAHFTKSVHLFAECKTNCIVEAVFHVWHVCHNLSRESAQLLGILGELLARSSKNTSVHRQGFSLINTTSTIILSRVCHWLHNWIPFLAPHITITLVCFAISVRTLVLSASMQHNMYNAVHASPGVVNVLALRWRALSWHWITTQHRWHMPQWAQQLSHKGMWVPRLDVKSANRNQ